jgi:flagellar biosynthesis chaperone FliJ
VQTFKYRLQVLFDLKIERRGNLQLIVAECQKELAAEREELLRLRHDEQVLERKLDESRRGALTGSGGATGLAIQQHRDYLSGLTMDLETARNSGFSQERRVREFEQRLAEVWKQLTDCLREIEVLEKHRDKLRQRFERDSEAREAAEQDEIGTAAFLQKEAR